MKELRAAMIQKQIQQHYPNARIVSYTDPESGLIFYTEKQLKRVNSDWFPLACHKDSETGALVFGGRGDVAHTYTIGETGAGKTTRFVMQSIRALASMPNKPSFLVTDMHGEIIENLYAHLRKNGYEIKILNCDDPQRSDTYNPFAALVKTCRQTGQIDDEGHNMLRKIAEIIQPVESTQDPIWDMGARSYAHGCILDKFEALLAHEIPPQCITLYNIINSHYWLREKLGEKHDLCRIPYYARKPRTAMSVQKIISVTDNAERTRRSYWGVVENHYDVFGQTALYTLSSSSSIDVAEFIEKPTAIIVQSGSSACGDHLVSLMVSDIYNTIVRQGKKQRTKRLPRPIHCFLDEFANCHIADGPAFIKMLTTSRKFGMHWHMLLQSDAQIESKYDKNIASIVRANCTEIFLGSYDHDTADRFATACGQKTIESLSSRATQQVPVLEVTDLLTADRLNLMEPGWVYVRSRRHPLLCTYYEAFYNCREYIAPKDIDAIYPHNDFDYRQTAFTPDDLVIVGKKEMAVMEFVQRCGSCTETELTSLMSRTEVRQCLNSLLSAKLVKKEDGMISRNIPSWHLDLLKEWNASKEAAQNPSLTQKSTADFGVFDALELMNVQFTEPPKRADSAKQLFQTDTMDTMLNLPLADRESLAEAENYTCIPEEICDNLQLIAKGQAPEDLDGAIQSGNLMKFEILEAFISANDFKRKEQWVKALHSEVQAIKQRGWFREKVLQSFDAALREIEEELTLSNIREIKKIIKDDD